MIALANSVPFPDHVRARIEHQEDGQTKSPKIKALTHKFLIYHAASFICAMGTLTASVYYAMCIAEKCL